MRERNYPRGYTRNQNTIRHKSGALGSKSKSLIFGGIIVLAGLMYVSQASRTTNYDYSLAEVEAKISNLEAKREELIVEKARLSSIANANKNKVAMEKAEAVSFVEE